MTLENGFQTKGSNMIGLSDAVTIITLMVKFTLTRQKVGFVLHILSSIFLHKLGYTFIKKFQRTHVLFSRLT